MNQRRINLLSAAMLAFVIPMILFYALFSGREEIKPPTLSGNAATEETTFNAESNDSVYITVLMQNGNTEQMLLDEYVKCVVLAEMPASFEYEALKAQAIVARTYTLRRHTGTGKHPNASVCTDPSCCQGYCTEENYLDRASDICDLNKIRQAVTDTKNMVLMYDGSLIEATYFSCSGGSTEDAAAVWGVDVPYLQATESPGEEDAAHYADTEYFTAAEFRSLLGKDLPGDPSGWFGRITYTSGQGVATIEIGNESYSGSEVRRLLGLRSTAFSVVALADTIVITTKGYGHRVGMSQYGADAMALQGKTCQEILSHYYEGTQLVSYVG